jgi:murein DD-endopeptidase MepM/ murein hydrolase activator NlpD
VLVQKGQYVQQKALIGLVGATGRTTGPHLHYEVIRDGRHLNPENVNKGARGRPLEAQHFAAFEARRDSLLTTLADGLRQRTELASAPSSPVVGIGQ